MASTMTRPQQNPDPPARPPRSYFWLLMAALVVAAVLGTVGYSTWSPSGTPAPDRSPVTAGPTAANLADPGPLWSVVIGELLRTSNDLRAHPDPSQLTEYLTPMNPLLLEAREAQKKLAAGDWRYDPVPGPVNLVSVSVRSFVEGAKAEVLVKFDSPRYRVVDAAGAVINDTAPTTGSTIVWHLMYNGQWRLDGTSAA